MAVYNLITLSAENMVAKNGYQIEKQKDGNWSVSFRYNLPPTRIRTETTETYDRDIILCEKEQPDCALFYQLEQCLSDEEKNVKYPEDILRQSIVYIDFDKVFKNRRFNLDRSIAKEPEIDGITEEVCKDYKNRKDGELKGDNGISYRLEWMFDPDNGIELSFDGKPRNDKNKVWKKFVPFEKSSSMSRNCLITFVDKELKAKVENRLLLNIDFSDIQVVLSKYYAYRGLYLSSGYRIEQTKDTDTFCLNEETVIVIDDEQGHLENRKVFTANNKNPKDENSIWTFAEKNKDIYPNLFDGEGLICPSYAKYISNQLIEQHGFTKDSFCFQCRMPMTKGMLFQTDFNQFLSDQLNGNKAISSLPKKIIIKDVFGITRDLKKAKIILTKSMFKGCNWLKRFCASNKIADPMHYYFQKVDEFQHALYITNTDARFSDEACIPLNYQFFSTLDLPAKDFEEIIKWHIERIKSVPEEIIKNRDFIEQDETDDAENLSDENSMATHQKANSVWKKCLKALAKNNAFKTNPKIKRYIEIEQQRLATNLCMGRLNVPGEQRFFSSDLLALLRFIYKRFIYHNFNYQPFALKQLRFVKVNRHGTEKLAKHTKAVFTQIQEFRKQLKSLRQQSLFAGRFYMPEKAIAIKPNKYYVFLRNPHLSRNEQCILRPLTYNPEKGNLYSKYFSVLKGLVMVSCESMVPMALSGADFDGDMVKIVCDSRIVKAVKKGVYKKTKHNQYERNLPVVVIPSVTAVEEKDRGFIPFTTIKNTFSNHIGQVSNIAIKLAKKEYGKDAITQKDVECGNCCPACTVVTGIEIDSAKSGIHPKANINSLQKNVTGEDTFLAAKKALKAIDKKHYSPAVVLNDDATLTLYLTKDGRSVDGLTNIQLYTTEDCIGDHYVPNIDRLPGQYLKCIKDITEDKAYHIPKDKSQNTKPCFSFEKEKGWKNRLEKGKKENLLLLIQAYLKIRSLNSNLNRAKAVFESQSFFGHVKTLLKIQYDDGRQKLPCNVEINDAIEQAYDVIHSIIIENAKAEFKEQSPQDGTTEKDYYRKVCKDVLLRLKESKWQYTTRQYRKEVLSSILAVKTENENQLTPATIQLLSNFQNGGYMIFFYILKDIQIGLYADIDSTEYIKMEMAKDKPKFAVPVNNDYFNVLYKTYAKYSERKQLEWNKQVVKKCRNELAIIFENDMDLALEYVCSLPANKDKEQDFFWNIFTADEIIKNIAETKQDA